MIRVSLKDSCNKVEFAERSGVQYEIKDVIGRGASCIVYYAVGSDNTEHLLKEYYPKSLGLSREGTGRDCPHLPSGRRS